MEHHHFLWAIQLQMAIFNSYAKLPEGTSSSFVSEIYRIVTGM
jgi:hypothetical protein